MSHELTPQAGMRIASLAIYVYDFIVTIPSEYRLYKRQKSFKRPSTSCCLFIAIRYIGLLYIVWVTNVFFVKWSSLDVCRRIAPVGGIFRGILSSLSAAIFVWRTWVIWGRNRNILIALLVLLIPVTFFSYIPSLIQKPVITAAGGCTGVSRGTGPLALKWPFALVNLIFDTVVCSLGTFKLIKNVKGGQSRISTVLLTDGIIYYVIAVTIQAMNLVFLLSPDPGVQGTFLTMQTITTAILGQRIITSLSERTTSTPSSHQDSTRTRDRSGSRGRGIWSTSARPPAIVSAMRGMTGPNQEDRMEMSMMKIEVNTSTHVHDDESIPGMEKRGSDYP